MYINGAQCAAMYDYRLSLSLPLASILQRRRCSRRAPPSLTTGRRKPPSASTWGSAASSRPIVPKRRTAAPTCWCRSGPATTSATTCRRSCSSGSGSCRARITRRCRASAVASRPSRAPSGVGSSTPRWAGLDAGTRVAGVRRRSRLRARRVTGPRPLPGALLSLRAGHQPGDEQLHRRACLGARALGYLPNRTMVGRDSQGTSPRPQRRQAGAGLHFQGRGRRP